MNFRSLAQESMCISPLAVNRVKVALEEIPQKYPGGVTLSGFDVVVMKGKEVPLFLFAENDTEYFFGNGALMKMVKSWITVDAGEHGGEINVNRTSGLLRASGGIRVVLTRGVSQEGELFTDCKVL